MNEETRATREKKGNEERTEEYDRGNGMREKEERKKANDIKGRTRKRSHNVISKSSFPNDITSS